MIKKLKKKFFKKSQKIVCSDRSSFFIYVNDFKKVKKNINFSPL